MKFNKIKGALILLVVAIICGVSFVFKDQAAQYVGPFTLNAFRSLISTIFLIPVVFIKAKIKKEKVFKEDAKQRKDLIISGVMCGVFLCIAMNIQQFGMGMYPPEAASSGRSGFLTAMYVMFVPFLGLFLKNKLKVTSIISIFFAVVGMYFLCFTNGIDEVYLGDLIVLCSALGFALQILCVNYYSDKVDGVKLSLIEFFVCSILSFILMFIFEKPTMENLIKAIGPFIYLGVVHNGIGYTLQVIGQQYSKNPTVDSIILSLESVFAVIGGAIILHEVLTTYEIIGCVIMFIAIIIAQLPSGLFKKKKKVNEENS